MGKLRGFLEFDRVDESQVNPSERIKNYSEFTISPTPDEIKKQGGRCMDCGVPFCHSGCPLGNLIPDFNDAVYKNDWKKALNILHSTNNFPEFTGRLCPAPCEQACVLGIVSPPVSIEMIEKYIVEKGFKEGWIKPIKPTHNTGKKVAVIGSGPAGLAAAQQLNRAGHGVTVFEKDNKIGGLLRYGIPDFKMEKNIIDIWNKGKFNLIFSQVLKENDSINGTKILKEGSFNSFLIDKAEFIKINNELIAPGRISYKIRKAAKPKTNNFNKNSKSFFLVNKTIQNIKVYIPGVKNPIIDSNTRLFLNLKIGQRIFLRFGSEMRELIKINDSIQNNSQINLADLIDNAINK